MGLEFPVGQNDLDRILHLREMELKRFVYDSSGMKIVLYFTSDPVYTSGIAGFESWVFGTGYFSLVEDEHFSVRSSFF